MRYRTRTVMQLNIMLNTISAQKKRLMPLSIMVGDAFPLDLLAINVSSLADLKTSSFIVKASHFAHKSLEPLQIFDLWFSSPHKKKRLMPLLIMVGDAGLEPTTPTMSM